MEEGGEIHFSNYFYSNALITDSKFLHFARLFARAKKEEKESRNILSNF